jgi:mannose-6-phosphate isomerase-like protein (cupin superfamily)
MAAQSQAFADCTTLRSYDAPAVALFETPRASPKAGDGSLGCERPGDTREVEQGGAVAVDPFILQPGAGRSIDLGGFLMNVKASGDETEGAFTLLEASEPPNFGPPMHVHRDAAEAFYVLEGEYIIFIDGTETRCPAGSFVYIPRGVVHGFRVGDRPSKKLNLYVQAAMVGYFDELADAVASGDANDELLGTIAERYGMEILGPVSEGYV